MDQNNEHIELSHVILHLFNGIIYRENNEKLWANLVSLHSAVLDYIAVLNLILVLDEAEGYAFLKHKPDEEGVNYPKLITRRSLTFEVSLLLALLRKSLVEFDANNGETRFILSQSQIIDLMRTYLKDSTNETKLIDKIENTTNKVVELGFLQKLKSTQNEPYFEVKRILKAFIDVEWLQQFNQWLSACLENKKV